MSNSRSSARRDTSAGHGLPTTDAIEQFLAWRLVRTARVAERSLVAAIAAHGLTTTEFGALAVLAADADATQSDLARALLVRPQTIGPLVSSLIDDGYVTRRGPGGRGRRTYFDLTARGRRMIERAWPSVTTNCSPARFGLHRTDVVELDRLLRTVETCTEPDR